MADDQRRLTLPLEAERRQREAAAKPPAATGIKPLQSSAPSPAASGPRKKKGQQASKDDTAVSTTARVPPAPKKPAR